MWIFGWKGPSGFSASSTAEQVTEGIDGTGLTAIVTGGSSGIGVETCRVLALRGVHVIMAVRNVQSGKSVKETITKEIPNAKTDVMELDLSSLKSVRKFASEYNSSALPLNILVNNAGIMAPPFQLTKDNIESQFATNHLGHFVLTNLLLDNMKRTAHDCQREGRIVNVASEGHRLTYKEGIHFDTINDSSSYRSVRAYGQTKLANILHANELGRRLKEEGAQVTANSLHPGIIATKITRNHGWMEGLLNHIGTYFVKNIPQGAATTCYVALNPQLNGVTGEYFSNSNVGKRTAFAKDANMAKKLWDLSLKMTQSN